MRTAWQDILHYVWSSHSHHIILSYPIFHLLSEFCGEHRCRSSCYPVFLTTSSSLAQFATRIPLRIRHAYPAGRGLWLHRGQGALAWLNLKAVSASQGDREVPPMERYKSPDERPQRDGCIGHHPRAHLGHSPVEPGRRGKIGRNG